MNAAHLLQLVLVMEKFALEQVADLSRPYEMRMLLREV